MMDLQLAGAIAPSLTMPLVAPAPPSAGINQPSSAARRDIFDPPTTVAEQADAVAERYHQSFGAARERVTPPDVAAESNLLSRLSDSPIGISRGGIKIELPTGAWDTTIIIKRDKVELETELRF
jgi:hypothetical protein